MLNNNGFDLWADDYDRSVGVSEEDGTYPFAGYRNILNKIYNSVLSASGSNVLDIGFGTGTLTTKLYEHGCNIYGQDFSERMIRLAQKKMPKAKLYQGDFSKGLVEDLKKNRYDAIIATYSLHHLTDTQKVSFLENLLKLLNEDGHIYIGDVMFENRAEMEKCEIEAGNEWDSDEIYFVLDELEKTFPKLKFERFSHCSGVLTLER